MEQQLREAQARLMELAMKGELDDAQQDDARPQDAEQRQAEELADMMGRSLAFSRFRIGQVSCDFYSTVSSGS